MRYRLAIFDFDGTLADSGPWMVKALNEAAPIFGYRQVTEAEIETLRGKDNRTIIREMGVPMWKLPFIAHHIRRKAANAPPPPLFDGVPQALDAIHKSGVRLAILSSNSEQTIRAALGAQACLIDLYACNAGLFGKAAKFKRLLREAAIPPQDAIGIGDEVRDIEAGHAAGVTCAAVSWGYATPALLKANGADMVFASVSEMTEYLSAQG